MEQNDHQETKKSTHPIWALIWLLGMLATCYGSFWVVTRPFEETMLKFEQARHLLGLDEDSVFIARISARQSIIIWDIDKFDTHYGLIDLVWVNDSSVHWRYDQTYPNEDLSGVLTVGEAEVTAGIFVFKAFDTYEDAFEWAYARRTELILEGDQNN